mmetsp:Transcript_31361/g.70476  ORF Transcript_31361/g.70476 Transcript_31361/m.70476 type:complete len:325 (-) Transcript_31361:87-1061(-)
MLHRRLLDDLHDRDVLVDLRRGGAEERGELKLVGGHLAVAGLERDPQLEALVLDLLHALEHRPALVERGHVVVAHFLAARGVLAHDGSAGELEVGAAEVSLTGDEEDLLLEPKVRVQARGLVPEQPEQPLPRRAHGAHGPVQRGLLVQGVPVVRDEARGDVDGVAPQEDGRGRVQAEVAARRVGRAHTAVGEGRAVGLPLEEVLALEVPLRRARLHVEVEHGVLDLARLSVPHAVRRQRLEPVRVHVGSVRPAPFEHRRRHLVSFGWVLGPSAVLELSPRHSVLRQELVRHIAHELVAAEALEALRGKGAGCRPDDGAGGGARL